MCDSCYQEQEALLEAGDGSQVMCTHDDEDEDVTDQLSPSLLAEGEDEEIIPLSHTLRSTPQHSPRTSEGDREAAGIMEGARRRNNMINFRLRLIDEFRNAERDDNQDRIRLLDEISNNEGDDEARLRLLNNLRNNDNDNNDNDNNDNDNNDTDNHDDDDDIDVSRQSFESGIYAHSSDDESIVPDTTDNNNIYANRYAGEQEVPIGVAMAAPQAQVLPGIPPAVDPDVLRPMPIILHPRPLRHSIDRFNFDGQHNNGALHVQYDDEFSDTDDDATHFDGRNNTIWRVQTCTTFTTTMQNLYTHDTKTQTGTMTHSYHTRRRNHRMRFTQVIPVTFRRLVRQ